MIDIVRSLLLVFLSLYFSSNIYCQNPEDGKGNLKSTFYNTVKYYSKEVVDTIYLDEETTSLSISIDLDDDFKDAILISKQDTFYIQEETHDPVKGNQKFSELIIFKNPIKSIIFIRGNIKSDVIFHLLNSGKTPGTNKINYRLQQGCGKPPTIDQAEWRKGLPAPNYSPEYSKVNHMIVHHSAGANNDTDFTYVVRQIYLYHTEVRNYSDIAYNFLIAPNGSIYEGREGVEEREEDVIGAHFCGKNTNTMGVCLLGNYETTIPAMAMLESLEQLMAWKLSKENLDPFEVNIHPSGTNSNLGNIAGHRDGCATLCPGEFVYTQMNVIKENTYDLLENIRLEIPVPALIRNEVQESGNFILEVTGGDEGSYIWFTSEDYEDSISNEYNSSFVIPPLFQDTVLYVSIREGACTGPLLKIDIPVMEDQFIISPNPTSGLTTIIFNKSVNLKELIILNSIGQKIDFLETMIEENLIYIDTSILSSGVYYIIVKSADKSFNKKLIVN